MNTDILINKYVNMFNQIANLYTYDKSTYVSDLKYHVLNKLQKSYPEFNLISEYCDCRVFCFKYTGTINHIFNDINFTIKLYFKITAKRTDELVPVSKTRLKYLNYIDKDPVKFSHCEISIEKPNYKFTKEKKIIKTEWISYETINIKVNHKDSIQTIINKIDELLNTNKYLNGFKFDICNDLIKVAMLNKKYYQDMNFENFINDNKQIRIEKLYQYIIDNNMLVK